MSKVSIGSPSPSFEGLDQHGNLITSESLKGKKVVLYFYPKDDTPGCTAQACNLRDNYQAILAKGIQVVGVSVDDVKSHSKFATKYDLPFPLIADTEKTIVESFGLWGEKKFMGRNYMGTTRTTYLIDESGTIRKIIDKPDTKNHTEEVFKAWESLD